MDGFQKGNTGKTLVEIMSWAATVSRDIISSLPTEAVHISAERSYHDLLRARFKTIGRLIFRSNHLVIIGKSPKWDIEAYLDGDDDVLVISIGVFHFDYAIIDVSDWRALILMVNSVINDPTQSSKAVRIISEELGLMGS